jgi:phosphoribosylformylglycinamidine synthase I
VKFGVVVFPGSNCDHDTYHVIRHVAAEEAVFLWHQDVDLRGVDIVILPGGFSYGDYLRSGAIAKFSPIMESVKDHAARGGLVLGICNGFQILQEAGLLPGAMLRNASLKFLCQPVYLRTEQLNTPFTSGLTQGEVLEIPIAHNDGNFFLPPAELNQLEARGQVVFRYVDAQGNQARQANPNGSLNGIAGIVNVERNVMGMMPHPERASEAVLGSSDGLRLIRSIVGSLRRARS